MLVKNSTTFITLPRVMNRTNGFHWMHQILNQRKIFKSLERAKFTFISFRYAQNTPNTKRNASATTLLESQESLIVTNGTLSPTDTKETIMPSMTIGLNLKMMLGFIKQRLAIYASLSKFRLSSLVVLTTLGGYALPSFSTPIDFNIIALTCLGTALCSFSANAFNQWLEVPFDHQMARTKNRVLPRCTISSLHAFSYGAITGLIGSSLLFNINHFSGLIGLLNIFLYSAVYTPLKRLTWFNTWIGSIVGALPPLIGSFAADPNCLSLPSTWILPLVLFSWQFPHFNSLAWNFRSDYSKAGYHMLSVVDPQKNSLVSLRYSLALFPISFFAYLINFVSPYFLLGSTVLNSFFAHYAFQFYKHRSHKKSDRKLFFFTLFYLPAYMALLILHKKGNDQAFPTFACAHSKPDAFPCLNPME